MAIAQSRHVADLITERTGRQVELVGITTFGDVSKAHLTQIGGTGVFVSALRQSLLSGEVDFAVHSLKDLPTAQPADIALAAVPRRDDPRDALVGHDGAKLADLPPGARVGTGSPRRAAQLRLLRADVEPVAIRGNANTRLGRVTAGDLDAVVLALAGLGRIAHTDAVTQIFEVDEMLPAPGQGALAIECRGNDAELAALLRTIDDAATRAAANAERSLLATLEAGCHAPVGAYAAVVGSALRLDAAVFGDPVQRAGEAGGASGAIRVLRDQGVGAPENAWQLGRELAERMLDQGAETLLAGQILSDRNDVQ
jgi:hydroxymethylbilane synthase